MSEQVTLHCPHCGQKLKIKDRSLFGQSVKCPGCTKPFVLRDPNEALTIDASSAVSPPPAPPTPNEPVIPDFSKNEPTVPTYTRKAKAKAKAKAKYKKATGSGEMPVVFPGQSKPTPKPLDFLQGESPPPPPTPFPGMGTGETEEAFNTSPKFVGEPAATPHSPTASPADPSAPDAAPVVPIAAPAEGGTAALERLRHRRKRGRWVNFSLVGIFLVVAIGVIGYFFTLEKGEKVKQIATANSASSTESAQPKVKPNEPYSRALLETDDKLVNEFEPTAGQPIELYMMPSGVNLVLHLRPAQLWSEAYDYQVLRASLTDDVSGWIANWIKTFCRRDPSKIDDLNIGIILGARGTQPQYCAVVKLVEPEPLSDLIDDFPGKYLYEITERPDLRIKVDDQYACLIHDEQTYAICPASMANELEYSIKFPNQDVTAGMAELLQLTDRDRLFTAIANVRDLQIYGGALVPPAALPFLNAVINWVGEDVEMVSWSIHPEPYFHSEIELRPVTTKGVRQLEADVQSRLKQLPQIVWKDLCAKMQPREVRFRKLIGRLPAMLEVVREATVSNREHRRVRLTTVLPAKATPNLALATLFTVNEAARTDFAAMNAASVAQSNKPKLPDTVVGRMKLPVDAEFNRTPLEQALSYLCGEVQINLHVDGDALKDAGYTKNMPQTFKLGVVPMQRALFEIINRYQERDKEMVISINEQTKTMTVLTRKFAEKQGLPIYPLKAE